jgi:alpha-mannosidase
MVGNAHIDPVWLWQWQEGFHQIRATFRSALDRMDEYEDFVFTCDSVAYLEWVERVDPRMFATISRRVAEGRFVVVGGWWVEPDCNLPHGESFVRQALYSQRFLQDRFGRIATVGCNVDPFGHAATIPQLLAKSGMDAYLFLRPEPKEKVLPGEIFWWSCPDGSRVLAYRIPYAYCSPGEALGPFLERVLERAPADAAELMVLYGVGNHGGGPTRENLDSIRQLDAADNGLRLRLTSPRQYFDAMARREDVPTYTGDLQHHAVGCYSAHSGVKRWNRRAEHLLMAAERWSTLADRLGGPAYPAEQLARAWKLVLFNQFHDTLAGTAIAPAYDDARDQYGYASTVAADALNLAVQSLTSQVAIAAEEGTIPLVVVNTLAWPVRADVEFELDRSSAGDVAAFDEESGAPVPVQTTASLATLGGRHCRLVLAADVPALGYRVYRLRPQRTKPSTPAPPMQELVLENPHLRVELSATTGWVTSFVDKDRNVELAPARPGRHAIVREDTSDTWSHDLATYDGPPAGAFSRRSARVSEDGPVRKVIDVESVFGASRLIERFVLGARARHLEVNVALNWQERQRVLKLRFPSALAESKATFSVPYGRIGRPNGGSEEVAHAWVDVSGVLPGGQRAGWSLLNDGKYAYDVSGAEIGMTAARSPVFAWHDPHKLIDGERHEYLDQGWQEFAYALVPHSGEAPASGVVRLAEELNERPLPFLEHFHPGEMPPAQSWADDGGGDVMVTVLKKAEDGAGVVLRAYDTTGAGGQLRIELPFAGRTIEARFGPGEVKTFLVPDNLEDEVDEVSLLEWPPGGGPPQRRGADQVSTSAPMRAATSAGTPAIAANPDHS